MSLGASIGCALLTPLIVSAEEKAPVAAAKAPAEQTGTPTTELEPGADFVCEAKVSYTWKRRPTPPPAGTKPGREDPPPAPIEPTTEFFTTIGEQGIVEQDTKLRVASKLESAQAQALEACRKTHESQAGCVTDKLRKTSPDYSRMDFAGRKAILESINADCVFNLGDCVAAAASEVICHTNRPPDLAPHAAPASAEAAPAAGAKAEAAKAESKDKKKK